MGKRFEGFYDIHHNCVELYRPENYQDKRLVLLDKDSLLPTDHPLTNNSLYKRVLEEVELIKKTGDAFNKEKIFHGEQTPVFFVSVLTNFGM